MSRRKYVWNTFQTTLSSPIDATQATIGLASVTNLRAPGFIVIDHDDPTKYEVITFTGVASLDLTGCERGLGGSVGGAGSAHGSGAAVRVTMVHQIIDDIFSDIEDIETAMVAIDAAIADLEAVDAAHIGAGGTVHDTVDAGGSAGFMTGDDKNKLDGIEVGATTDQTPAEIQDAMQPVTDALETQIHTANTIRQAFHASGGNQLTVTATSLTEILNLDAKISIPADWISYQVRMAFFGSLRKDAGTVVASNMDLQLYVDGYLQGWDVTLQNLLNQMDELQRVPFYIVTNGGAILRAEKSTVTGAVYAQISSAGNDVSIFDYGYEVEAWRIS